MPHTFPNRISISADQLPDNMVVTAMKRALLADPEFKNRLNTSVVETRYITADG